MSVRIARNRWQASRKRAVRSPETEAGATREADRRMSGRRRRGRRSGPARRGRLAAPEPETPEQRIVQALADAETPLSQRQIRERAATRHKTVGAILGKLVCEGRVERDAAGGYGIVEAGMNKPTPDDDVHGNQPSDAPRFPVPGSRNP